LRKTSPSPPEGFTLGLCSLLIARDGSARGAIGSDTLAVIRDAEVGGGILEFKIAGALPVAETAGQPQRLELKWRRVQQMLGGYVAAQVKLGDRPFLVLPFPVCLWRAEQGVAARGAVRPSASPDAACAAYRATP
jgi:hypothetical protein